MRFSLAAVPVLAAVSTLASPVHYVPAEVQEYVAEALQEFSRYALCCIDWDLGLRIF